MARVLLGSVTLLAATAGGAIWEQQGQPAKIAHPSTAATPILEVISRYSSSYNSMSSLYLRYFDDGTAEYHDSQHIDLTKPIPLSRKKLPIGALNKLRSLVDLPEIQQLAGSYERDDLGIFHETLEISLFRDGHVQRLFFVNFDSHREADGKRSYPEEAVRLGCMIEHLRHKVLNTKWEAEECKKLLELK